MKKFNPLRITALFIMLSFLVTNCKKDHTSPSNTETPAVTLEINKFIWGNLNYWYYWVDSVPKLSYSYFQNDTNNINAFLKTYTDHEKLFNDLLYTKRDKWSWIVDDYTVLEGELQGITKSMGFDFGLLIYGSAGTNVFGYIRYIYPNSPASAAGLKRGDIFTTVNGQQITVSNYQTLLFNQTSYQLGLATIVNNTITPNGKQVTIVPVVLQENPVFLDTVYTINSNKIGYLVYNGFYPDFDVDLNNAFAKFKANSVQNLILDLRYNGGGSVQSAIYLASMIYGTNSSDIFATTQYNSTVQADIIKYYGASYLIDHFIDTIARATASGSPTTITSLGLNQLYVITSKSTASASELVINGLKPYLNVTTVGDTTVGKNVGSITITDVIDAIGTVNPNNKWAMQPIVLKIFNSQGKSDYSNGFAPKVVVDELRYLSNLLPLGDTNEPLLKAALNDLQGLPQSSMTKSASAFKKFADLKDMIPHSKEMYSKLNFSKLHKKYWPGR
ncbi:MAG TPA: S41 family peptidase [Bacteroidales bacterium]